MMQGRQVRGNSKRPLVNGFILLAIGIYVGVYITLSSMWNVGTVFAMVLIAALSALQFLIYFKVFRKK